ncbi:MAG: DNA-3-methyladenine glycosylase 2 family protein [Candidatus Thorarchaeota archaeon]|nr:DNA-3-methyladenine glycosylase 2 family protein [Candidatus Thorarchaeota archaeon]
MNPNIIRERFKTAMPQKLKVPESYNLLSSIHSWILPDVQPVPEMTSGGTFSRSFTINGTRVPLKIQQCESGEPLEIECTTKEISKRDITRKMTRTLNLKLPLEDALETMSNDPVLDSISEKVSIVRPYLADTVFEGLLKSIIQQQISYRAANVITKRIVIGLGTGISDESYHQFPSASTIVSAGVDMLRSFGIGYKTDYVFDLCIMIEKGELDPESLMGLQYDEVHEILVPIRGIGDWTIQALSIAGLGDYSTFPYGDLAIQNILGKLYQAGRRYSKKEVIEFAEAKGEQGPLILYLLMCADALGFIANRP